EVELAFSEADLNANTQEELEDMYAPHFPEVVYPSDSAPKSDKRYIDSISEGIWMGMQKYPELIFMGQDIAEYGGAFKISQGFVEEFGKARVRNTPICESAIVGAALGLSINKHK